MLKNNLFFNLKESQEIVFGSPSCYPDLHQNLMGSILGWDPSEVHEICSVVFVKSCWQNNHLTDTDENITFLAEVICTSVIYLHIIQGSFLLRKNIAPNQKYIQATTSYIYAECYG